MTTALPAQRSGGGGGTSGLYDVLELILDRGLVIDAFVRVSLVGIEILKIDVRVVVASVDTYLRFAEACNRLDLESGPNKSPGLPEVLENATESGASSKTRGALSGAAESLTEALRSRAEEREAESATRKRRSTTSRKEDSE